MVSMRGCEGPGDGQHCLHELMIMIMMLMSTMNMILMNMLMMIMMNTSS